MINAAVKEKEHIYLCIDMKCFYASVECAEKGRNPFETPLVVADETRGKGALCLAISPKMKAMGVKNRCRLFEIPQNIKYEIAKPRMKKYIEYASDIYRIYRQDFGIDAEDIHVYSIDEAFIDATEYIKDTKTTPKQYAKMLIDGIAKKKKIPATAGIGTNLYLAKVALDITAKKTVDHLGYLDEETYRKTLWQHKPLTDFWMIGEGTVRRLKRYGATTMEDIANLPREVMLRTFGVNGELIQDHAWGREPCTMADIKAYKSKTKSVSSSQILPKDYNWEQALVVMKEMTLSGCHELMRKGLITNRVGISIGYSNGIFPNTGGETKMYESTNVPSIVSDYVVKLYNAYAIKDIPIRQLAIWFNGVTDQSAEGYDLFTNFEQVEKEKKCEHAVISIMEKFGKNAILRGIDFEDGATTRERNKQIGGHNSE